MKTGRYVSFGTQITMKFDQNSVELRKSGYYPQLERDEAVLIKTHDSSRDGRCRFAPHAAFRNPAAPSGAPPRESVESRAFAFFSAVDQVQPA